MTLACKASGIKWKLNWQCKIAEKLTESIKVNMCDLEFIEFV